MKRTTKNEIQDRDKQSYQNRQKQAFKAKKKESLGDVFKESSKVQTFVMDRPLTPELRKYIEQTSYSELLMEINQNENTKESFQDLLTRFLSKIILQKEGAILLV